MRAILVTMAVLSLGLAAHAATDEEKFKKLLNQTTAATGPIGQIIQKGKAACVCVGGEANSQAGVLVRRRFGDDRASFFATCFVPSFDTDGSAVASFECLDWELLTN